MLISLSGLAIMGKVQKNNYLNQNEASRSNKHKCKGITKYAAIYESGQYLSLPEVVLALGLTCLPPCKSENQSEDL